jgi:hypothetical protein
VCGQDRPSRHPGVWSGLPVAPSGCGLDRLSRHLGEGLDHPSCHQVCVVC